MVVVGAGVIGLGVAWRVAQRGLSVTVVDPAPASGASGTAAGMLAPVTELYYGEHDLLQLNLASARRYPEFVEELEACTGSDVGFAACGTVVAAWDAADLVALRDLLAFQHSLGLDAKWLTAAELRSLEGDLAAGLPGGVFAASDHQVDPRRLCVALRAAAERCGAVVVERRAAALETKGDRVCGVRFDDGELISAGTVVLAAGAWSAQVGGLPPDVLPPVRPVKGQVLRLAPRGGFALRHVVRGHVRGVPVYLVPRPDGELVVGASSEEAGFGVWPRAGAVHDLLRDAGALVPGIDEAELVEVSTSVRPGTPDNAPVLGRSGVEGLVFATGHYRNGVLLAPITADGVAALLAEGATPPEIAPFDVERFRPPAAATPEAQWT